MKDVFFVYRKSGLNYSIEHVFTYILPSKNHPQFLFLKYKLKVFFFLVTIKFHSLKNTELYTPYSHHLILFFTPFF